MSGPFDVFRYDYLQQYGDQLALLPPQQSEDIIRERWIQSSHLHNYYMERYLYNIHNEPLPPFVKLVMLQDKSVADVTEDAVELTTKATDLFLQHLLKRSIAAMEPKSMDVKLSDIEHATVDYWELHFLNVALYKRN